MGLFLSRLITRAAGGQIHSRNPYVNTSDLVESEYISYLNRWRYAISSGVDLPPPIISIIHAYVTAESKYAYFMLVLKYRELKVDHHISEQHSCSASFHLTERPSRVRLMLSTNKTQFYLYSGTVTNGQDMSSGLLLEIIELNGLYTPFLTLLGPTITIYSDWTPWNAFNEMNQVDECNLLIGEIASKFRAHASEMLTFGINKP